MERANGNRRLEITKIDANPPCADGAVARKIAGLFYRGTKSAILKFYPYIRISRHFPNYKSPRNRNRKEGDGGGYEIDKSVLNVKGMFANFIAKSINMFPGNPQNGKGKSIGDLGEIE